MPRYPFVVICGGIDRVPSRSDIIKKIFIGVMALRGNNSSRVNDPINMIETNIGWRWQVIIVTLA